MALQDTIIGLMAAWLLLAGAAYVAHRHDLGLSRAMLIASIRGPIQLVLLAFVLHWVFDITAVWMQIIIMIAFCFVAAQTSASHHTHTKQAWLATSIGLICGCAVTLPWLAWTGAIDSNTRALIPLASMVAANGMNAVSMMFERIKQGGNAGEGMRIALIPTIDTLKVVGLVHMPGIFVGMILAGSPPMQAASAQLTVLYMIVASSFTACMVTFLLMKHWLKAETS
ncbi:MAG: ABC transporter permease [Mariprofundaceae bacterium]|nr:ABC transporter permease [Mariprofundaceae bacterium]